MWRLLAGALGMAALLAGASTFSYRAGWDHRDAAAKGDQLAQVRAQVAQLQTVQRAAFSAGQAAVDHQAEIRWHTRLIHDQVPRLVSVDTDRRFPLPVGFVRVTDAAAAGELPPAPGVADGAASGVAASRAADIIAENYGTCHATAQQLRDLQDWTAKMAGLSTE